MDDLSRNKKSKGAGKQPKHFLEHKDALDLATSITDLQEGKSINRAKKRHRSQPGLPRDRKARKTSSKERIKDKKAIIIAERAQAKKLKAKNKIGVDGGSDGRGTGGSGESLEPARKRVTFA